MARGLLRNGAVVSAVVLVTAAGSLLSGCREDPAGLRAINNASSRLGSVTGGAEVAVDSKFQSAAYADVLKMLAEAKVDAADPMAGAAGVITASAHLGSAGPAADAAVSSMRTVSSLRSELRSARSQWVTLSAVAQAAAFDSGPVIAELDKQLSTAKGELAEAQGRLDKLQADQDKMRGDAKAKADQANTFELESVKLREQTRAMSATNAQPVLAKALEAKAKCDELRLQSSNIEAEAMLLEPRKLEINQRRQELDIGIKSLETERARAQKRGTDAADIEKQAKDKAAGAAKSVESLVKQLDEERAKLLPEFDRVIDACRKAASASASKTPGRDAGGTALTARAQQRLGELLLVRAAESQAHAEQMSGLANATPALAGKSSYADAAKAATEAAKTAREEAKEALEKARTSYKALKPTGDAAKATRDEIVKYLTKVGGLTPEEGETPADAPAADPAVEKPAADQPAAEGAKPVEGEKPAEGDKPAEPAKDPAEPAKDPVDQPKDPAKDPGNGG